MKLFGWFNKQKPEGNIDTVKENLSHFELQQFEEMIREFNQWGFLFEIKQIESIKTQFKEYIERMKPEAKTIFPSSSDEEIIKFLRRDFQHDAIEASVKSWRQGKSDSEIETEIIMMKKEVRQAKRTLRHLTDSEMDSLERRKAVLLDNVFARLKKRFPDESDEKLRRTALYSLRQQAIETIVEFWEGRSPNAETFADLQQAALTGRLKELYLENTVSFVQAFEREVLVEEFMDIVIEEHWARRFDRCFEGMMAPTLWTLRMGKYVLLRHIAKYR